MHVSELRMRSLNDHKVPPEMLSIGQKLKPIEIAALVEEAAALESSQEGYVRTFTKMLHLEEVAESRFLIQFNAKNIQLRCVEDRLYCIPIEVRQMRKMMSYIRKSVVFTNRTPSSLSSPSFCMFSARLVVHIDDGRWCTRISAGRFHIETGQFTKPFNHWPSEILYKGLHFHRNCRSSAFGSVEQSEAIV